MWKEIDIKENNISKRYCVEFTKESKKLVEDELPDSYSLVRVERPDGSMGYAIVHITEIFNLGDYVVRTGDGSDKTYPRVRPYSKNMFNSSYIIKE